MMATRLLFILFFSFATILPCLCADMAQYDDVWQKRAEEAKKHTMEAYVPNPLETDEEADSQSVHIGSPPPTSSGLPPQTCAQPQNDTVGTPNGAESPTKGEQTITADQTSPSPTPTPAVAEDDDEDTTAAAVAGNTNATRRGLRQGKRLYKGPCAKTNPIDKCWRCRKSWSKNRRRLAKCALGFGRKTTGGADGRIYVVTDNSDDDFLNPKPGTLRYAVIQKEPLWIIFAHSMNIKLNKELIMAGNKTIDGRGANVHIAYGAGITIQFVSNVIIHGIRIHHIVPTGGGLIRDSVDHFGFRTQSDGDGISIFGSTKVWIDHVSMSNCTDGLIDAIQGSTAVTISNCHFTHHNDAILLGASDSFSGDQFMQITVAYNHFGQGLVQRMPRCRWGFFHVVNNDYTHWRLYAIGGSQHPTIISQGNRFIAPDEHELKQVTKRDYAAESEWRNWIWRSEGDLFMNGAYFIESGQQNLKPKQQKKFMITPKPAVFATKMTRMAGALDCRPKQKC